MVWHELTRGVVMPAHCDVFGHMNVRHYAAFFDEAGWQMFGRIGVSLAELRKAGLGSVVATLTIEAQLFARACGKTNLHSLEPEDLAALTMEASAMAGVPLAGTNHTVGVEDYHHL